MKQTKKVLLFTLTLTCLTLIVNAQPFKEAYEPGIILLSISSITDKQESINDKDLYKGRRSLSTRSINSLEHQSKIIQKQSSILDIQLEIAIKASKFNKVLLLVPDRDTYYILKDRGIISEFNSQINAIIINHDAVWIRDYGPYFNLKDSILNILDAKYHDSRYNSIIQSAVFNINRKRESIIKELMVYQEFRELSVEEMQMFLILLGIDIPEKEKESYILEIINETNKKIDNSINDLAIYKTYIEVLTDNFTQRFNDDQVPKLLPEKVYGIQNYKIEKLKNFNMSGGNFLINNNCQCFTTTELILKNNNNKSHIDSILTNKYGCKDIIYLKPLPGENIIKHIDMFFMPLDSNNVLLASFNPEYDILKNEWNYSDYLNLNSLKTDISLAIEAEIAMRKNKRILEKNGFNVISIPSFLPKKYTDNPLFEEPTLFYPTFLNCLVQISDDNNTIQVLMPYYEDLSNEIFEYSKKIIQKEFTRAYGNERRIVIESIECTRSAMAQGAIHCLTLTIPKLYSKYFDSFFLSEKEKIENILFEY